MNAPFHPLVSTKLVRIGDDHAIVLDDQALAHLGVVQGDTLDVEVTDTGVTLRRHVPTHDEKMRVAEQIMDEDREILRVLAQ